MRRSSDVSAGTLPEANSIIRGEVTSLKPYGVFVKIPGCEKNGLVHISQISNSRVERPEDVLELKEKIYCKVISVEGDGQKISLSMKVVNQTTGQDLDPTQLQTSKDEQHKKKNFKKEFPKIELGAIFDTVCKKCGGKGHLAQDCFYVPGGKKYDLLEEVFEWPKKIEEEQKQKHGKKEKKKKKHKDKHKKEKEKSSKAEGKHHKKKHGTGSDSEDKDERKHRKPQKPASSSSDNSSSDAELREALYLKTGSESKHQQHSKSDHSTYSSKTSKSTKNEKTEETKELSLAGKKRSHSPSSTHKDTKKRRTHNH